MKTLHEAINAHAGQHAPALAKYLNECGLNEWADLTRANLNDFRDHVAERVAQSSARTYFAVFKLVYMIAAEISSRQTARLWTF